MAIFISDKTSKTKQYFFVSVLVLLVSALCFLFSDILGYRVTAFVLLVTVSIIAMLFDIVPVMLSAMLSALIWNYFFIPPRFTFHIHLTEDVIMFLMYFLIASVNAVLTYKIRQITKIAAEEEKKANTILLYNTLLNSLSHELRTPISTIIGASDIILNDADKLSEENKIKLVSEISEASLRLNRQVENLLNMSRLESGFIEPRKDWSDINELIYSVINLLEDSLKSYHVKITIAEMLPLFKIDFGLIQQVLINLISNAVVYTPAGSNICIEALQSADLKALILKVSDNGPGLPEEEKERVFEKFYRLKNSSTGGTGLGLSIVKGFVEAHHGTVKLSRNEGGGALFTLNIPAESSSMNYQKNE